MRKDVRHMKKEIYLAGGCFWGVERYFSLITGVTATQVGYANGQGPAPTYEEVCTGAAGFAEGCSLCSLRASRAFVMLLTSVRKILS